MPTSYEFCWNWVITFSFPRSKVLQPVYTGDLLLEESPQVSGDDYFWIWSLLSVARQQSARRRLCNSETHITYLCCVHSDRAGCHGDLKVHSSPYPKWTSQSKWERKHQHAKCFHNKHKSYVVKCRNKLSWQQETLGIPGREGERCGLGWLWRFPGRTLLEPGLGGWREFH